MIFEDWMRYKGLSESSILKYEGAIMGVLSEWAIDNCVISGPLTSINSKAQFDLIASKIGELDIFQERNKLGHHMYSSALAKYAEYLSQGYENDIEADIDSVIANTSIGKTEKSSLIKSRIGQGVFRQQLIGYWKGCAVTNFKDTNLLIASHIKPWRASSNAQRLDKFNGLLLTPNIDKVFDAGLITFGGDGKIRISPQLSYPDAFGVDGDLYVELTPQHEVYMEFHRSVVYRAK